MGHTKEEYMMAEERQKIKDYRNKIDRIIKSFVSEEFELNILSFDEQEEAKKLHSTVIAELNKAFYGLNIGDMKKDLKSHSVKAPKDYIDVLDIKHLIYYRSMLSKLEKRLSLNDINNHEAFHNAAINIGTRAYNYFIDNEKQEPYNNLLSSLLGTKEIFVEPKLSSRIDGLEVPKNPSFLEKNISLNKEVTPCKLFIVRTNEDTIILRKIRETTTEIIQGLGHISGIKSPKAVFHAVNDEILTGIYRRTSEVLIQTLQETYNIVINDPIEIMNTYHLTGYLNALSNLRDYVISKYGMSFHLIKYNLYEASFSFGSGQFKKVIKESTSQNDSPTGLTKKLKSTSITPYQDLVNYIKVLKRR